MISAFEKVQFHRTFSYIYWDAYILFSPSVILDICIKSSPYLPGIHSTLLQYILELNLVILYLRFFSFPFMK